MGYVISRSLIVPVQGMHQRFSAIAQGEFKEQLSVANQDELGDLVSSLNHMSGELDRLYHQLELVSQHKSQFLANMSHELRTPLNAILGYTELITDEIYGPVPEKIKEVLERVEHNGRHLLGLINAVLDLSKIEAGQLSLQLDEYSLREVIFEAVTTVESLATEKGLVLQTVLPNDVAVPLARGDAPRLKQVLLNLLGNAIKFTDAGEVKVSTQIDTDHFTVAVSDTGPGIALDQQAHIFEEFQQVDNSITREKGGSGLGLAITKKIIQLHGGEVGVESELGRGSTFWFQIPINVLQQQEAA
jgi:signal transduction histidine kinase